MSNDDFRMEMNRILRYANNFSNFTLFCGDFNARAPTWSPESSYRKGIILENLVDDFGYTCLNDNSPTFTTPDGVRSVLDLSFIKNIHGNISWKALDMKICMW